MKPAKPDKNSQSICETCVAPGTCCRAMTIHLDVPIGMKRDELRDCLRRGINPWNEETMEPLPYEPIRAGRWFALEGEHKPHSCYWTYSCPKLDEATGLCTDYENRPYPCREYTAGQDPMCVHYDGDWEGYMNIYTGEEPEDTEMGES